MWLLSWVVVWTLEPRGSSVYCSYAKKALLRVSEEGMRESF